MEAELKKRVVTAGLLTGILSVVLAVAALSSAGRLILTAIACAVCGLCAFEFAHMCSGGQLSKIKGIIYFTAAFLPAAGQFLWHCCFVSEGGAVTTKGAALLLSCYFAATVMGAALTMLVGRRALSSAGEISREFWCGVFLIGLGGGALAALCAAPHASGVLLWLLLVVCGNDIAAYFAGRRYGITKLAPEISPNKTLVGSVGGLAAGVVIGLLCFALLSWEISWPLATGFCVGVTMAAQLGDLIKSYIKRLHGRKDSGSLLPGHGGALDRADALLMAAPIIYVVLLWRGF